MLTASFNNSTGICAHIRETNKYAQCCRLSEQAASSDVAVRLAQAKTASVQAPTGLMSNVCRRALHTL
eukprot:4915304-Pleurochrysis_carterae.AAC.1